MDDSGALARTDAGAHTREAHTHWSQSETADGSDAFAARWGLPGSEPPDPLPPPVAAVFGSWCSAVSDSWALADPQHVREPPDHVAQRFRRELARLATKHGTAAAVAGIERHLASGKALGGAGNAPMAYLSACIRNAATEGDTGPPATGGKLREAARGLLGVQNGAPPPDIEVRLSEPWEGPWDTMYDLSGDYSREEWRREREARGLLTDDDAIKAAIERGDEHLVWSEESRAYNERLKAAVAKTVREHYGEDYARERGYLQ